MEFGHLALGEGDDPDVGEAGLLVEGGDVLLVAGDAVEALGQHDVDGARADGLHQGLDTWTDERSAADRGDARRSKPPSRRCMPVSSW